MTYTLQEIKPSKPVLKLGKSLVAFRLPNLNDETYFAEYFGGVEKLFERCTLEPALFYAVLWHLIDDESKFRSYEEFANYCLLEEIEDIQKFVYHVFNQSRPKHRDDVNQKELEEINKAQKDDVDVKPCYADYYDRLATRYGYTLDQFFELTLNQLYILLKIQNDGSTKDLEIQAKLNGRELKQPIKARVVSEEQEKEERAHAEDALEMLKRRKQNKGLNNGR